jgi:16S rRNA (adenine1518-N6/adenine1519-N6)-dimethyltransferase
LGQHFLVDRGALAAILAAADVTGDDDVVEVGPGPGVLTLELARRARTLRTIELDRRLLPLLTSLLAPFPHAELIHGDALGFDFARCEPGSLFVANLPYQVGTAVLTRVIGSHRFRRIVVLVQREVGERLTAQPGTAAFGSLSLWVAHHGRARIVRNVAPGAFLPPPRVTSAIVRIDLDPGATSDPHTFAWIRLAFRHRRKTLASNLRTAGVDADAANAALAAAGIAPQARAETLDLATFRRLAAALPSVSAPGAHEGVYCDDAEIPQQGTRGDPR